VRWNERRNQGGVEGGDDSVNEDQKLAKRSHENLLSFCANKR
jgi:hypothetical protein